jgi:hypothetical protein
VLVSHGGGTLKEAGINDGHKTLEPIVQIIHQLKKNGREGGMMAVQQIVEVGIGGRTGLTKKGGTDVSILPGELVVSCCSNHSLPEVTASSQAVKYYCRGAVASGRSGNKRDVNQLKSSWMLARGIHQKQDLSHLANLWIVYGLHQCKIMFQPGTSRIPGQPKHFREIEGRGSESCQDDKTRTRSTPYKKSSYKMYVSVPTARTRPKENPL